MLSIDNELLQTILLWEFQVSKADVQSRQEYLRAQRDKILKIKRKARAYQLNETVKKSGRPTSATQAAQNILESGTSSAQNMQNDASVQLRKTLAKRLRTEVVGNEWMNEWNLEIFRWNEFVFDSVYVICSSQLNILWSICPLINCLLILDFVVHTLKHLERFFCEARNVGWKIVISLSRCIYFVHGFWNNINVWRVRLHKKWTWHHRFCVVKTVYLLLFSTPPKNCGFRPTRPDIPQTLWNLHRWNTICSKFYYPKFYLSSWKIAYKWVSKTLTFTPKIM